MQKRVKKNTKRVNSYTGKPRKWFCHNHGGIDGYLEEIEILHFYSCERRRKGQRPCGWDDCPRETLEALMDSLARRYASMKESLEHRSSATLSATEIRYCELEGIEPGDYLKAKGA